MLADLLICHGAHISGVFNMNNDKRAAVSYIYKGGFILCVWNKRYNGWSMPGGLVKDNETVEAGQARELFEETGLITVSAKLMFSGPHNTSVPTGRASLVYVFNVVVSGEPREMENGCPIAWLTYEEFLQQSPFSDFYKNVFLHSEELKQAKLREGIEDAYASERESLYFASLKDK